MWPVPTPGAVIGRDSEVELVRSALADTVSGRGGVVLVEGEPGIGRSALLRHGLAVAADLGCRIGWASADELSARLPGQLLLDCLELDPPADPDVAKTLAGDRAALAAAFRRGLPAGGSPDGQLIDQILAIVDRLCADAPLVLVADDLQWADPASLFAWLRLVAAARSPLLLVAACRPVPHRDELDPLRTAAQADGGLIRLGPLPAPTVADLLTGLFGGLPGPRLRALAADAAGNPRYLRELLDPLLADAAITVDGGVSELAPGAGTRAPAALAGRLDFLSADATVLLRAASLLGDDFSIDDIALVLGRPATDLSGLVVEATAAGVVAGDIRMSFRHPIVRRVLYEGMPGVVRSALHRHAAEALALAGAPIEQVARQLLPVSSGVDGWMAGWLAETAAELTDRAPALAADLLARTVRQLPSQSAHWERLAGTLARVLFRIGRDAEAVARTVLARTGDPDLAAEMRWLLGERLLRAGRFGDALLVVERGLSQPGLPAVRQARLMAMSARIRSTSVADLDTAEDTARRSLAVAEASGDRLATGYCLLSLATTSLMRRDEQARLAYLDRALDVLADDPDCVELRLLLLGNRVLALSILDRFAEAGRTLDEARELARRTRYAAVTRLHVPAAVLYLWTGRWDEALAELEAAGDLADNPRLAPLATGVGSLIACHRDDRTAASARLDALAGQEITTAFDLTNTGFVIVARGLLADRDGGPEQALEVFRELLDPRYAQAERHVAMPDVVRAALAVGDTATAREAADACERDPGQVTPGRLAALRRCRGLLAGDPDLLAAAGRYLHSVGRIADFARTCEDMAVLLARGGDRRAARSTLAKAMDVYENLRAEWDLRRAAASVRPYGIRWGARGPRRRPTYGWDALSPTELTIARLVAQGWSNPDIAAELLLSRRTVQSHVSRILMKLRAHSRVDIARETLNQG